MKHKRTLAPTLLLIPALMAMESRGESPAFGPSDGTSLVKHVQDSTSIALDEMSVIVGGQDMSEMLGGMEMEQTTDLAISVTDVFVTVSGGRPVKLTRTFDSLSTKSTSSATNPMESGEAQEMEFTGSSELEGETVHFAWDAESGEYDVKLDEESDGDEALLEGLLEDMDLRAFLPQDEVSPGDAWDVDPSALRTVFAPGGAVKIEPDDMESAGMGMGGNSPPNLGEFLEEFDGEVTVKFESVEGGIAILSLTVDVASSADLTDWLQDMMDSQEMPDGIEIEMDVESFDMEFTFEGTGELRWNLSAGHFAGLTLEGDIEVISDTAMSFNMGGMEQAIENSLTMSGTKKVTYKIGE